MIVRIEIQSTGGDGVRVMQSKVKRPPRHYTRSVWMDRLQRHTSPRVGGGLRVGVRLRVWLWIRVRVRVVNVFVA